MGMSRENNGGETRPGWEGMGMEMSERANDTVDGYEGWREKIEQNKQSVKEIRLKQAKRRWKVKAVQVIIADDKMGYYEDGQSEQSVSGLLPINWRPAAEGWACREGGPRTEKSDDGQLLLPLQQTINCMDELLTIITFNQPQCQGSGGCNQQVKGSSLWSVMVPAGEKGDMKLLQGFNGCSFIYFIIMNNIIRPSAVCSIRPVFVIT